MAVKTITIDIEAYERLSAAKQGKESFSKVIKRRLAPERTAASLLAVVENLAFDEDTLDYTEEIVKSRKQWVAESPIISEKLEN